MFFNKQKKYFNITKNLTAIELLKLIILLLIKFFSKCFWFCANSNTQFFAINDAIFVDIFTLNGSF